MQNKLTRIAGMHLRLTASVMILAICFSVMAAFKARKMYNDIWQQLGISKSKAEENIRESFLSGFFHYYGAEKAKHLLTGNRQAVAKDLLNFTKQQVNSEAFKKRYTLMRDNSKPQEPTERLRPKEEIRKEKIAEMEKSISESAKTIREMPDMAKTMQPVIEMLKSTLKDYKDPGSKNIEAFYQNEIYEHEYRIKRYKERLAEWEKNYPSNPNAIIRERLQRFISLAKTVDFAAELKTVGNKKKFVKPEYEGKPYDWKQIYRAGKEVIEPSIAFAEQWLKEIK